TIQSIRERTHWNIANLQPIDPVALGLCKQTELDAAVQKAAAKKAREGEALSDDDRRKLLSTEQSLSREEDHKIPIAIEGLETFTLSGAEPEEPEKEYDADSLFNLPESADEEDKE